MLRFIHGSELAAFPRLRETMFRDRAAQFRDRLGWAVTVDAAGWERDEYDRLDPLYVIWEGADGRHGGSMRFLPTTGRTMLAEHFAELLEGRRLADPRIWECTRFCLSVDAPPGVSAALMLGGAQVGTAFGLTHAAGVFDARMIRIYGLLGWPPEIVGSRGSGAGRISLGLWAFSDRIRLAMAARAGLSDELVRHWFLRSRPGIARAA
ncbi:MAG: autoinducer synthase [Rhodobacteraceae bacterium]|nr:autoinducer synthase [Paracoccaceae bacterium]